MEKEEKNIESGFKIHNIILLESNFFRVSNVEFDDTKIIQDVSIDGNVSINKENNTVSVIQTLHFTQTYKEELQIKATIKMGGAFEKVGDSVLDLEEFGHVNGAAIIYPYTREHLTSLSAKAGVGLILLPPANFTKND